MSTITTPDQAERAVADLLEEFDPTTAAQARTASPAQRRVALEYALTVRPPAPIPDQVRDLLDALLAYEAAQRATTRADDLPRLAETGAGAQISLWQGDITTLEIDAIVNAANNQMLGCFIPGHRCIDNVIHAVAGPGLRAECAAHMDRQGHLEPTGTATLTDGYHLPARAVLHTVGPIVPDHRPTPEDAAALASAYRSCLDLAYDHDLRSVAFCSISTGVFGYPIEAAALVALDAVTTWLAVHPDAAMHVVFNTFSDRDTTVYRTLLESRLR